MAQESERGGERSLWEREYGPFCTAGMVRSKVSGPIDLATLIAMPVEKEDGSLFYVYPAKQFRERRNDSGRVIELEPREFMLGVFNDVVRPLMSGTPGSQLDSLGFLKLVDLAGDDPSGQGLIDLAKDWAPKNLREPGDR